MIDIERVNWKNDGFTREYVRHHTKELEDPDKMAASNLGTACTYCETLDNPYAVEIMRRSGHLKKYQMATNQQERRNIFQRACRHNGLWFLFM